MKYKILILILFIFLNIHNCYGNCEIKNIPICGDLNNDSLVNGDDANLLKLHLRTGEPLNCAIPYCFYNVSGNNETNETNETVKIYNSTLIIKNNLNNPKILVFENGSFLNEYSNIDVIELKNNTNYTIIINEKFIDIINKKHFLSIILIEYGYIIISLLGIIILCSIIIYIYNKIKGK